MAGPARRKSLKTLIKEVTVGLANTFRNNINENNKNIIELKELLEKLHKDNTKYYILGGGSNVILPDEDFDGAIIKLDKLNEFKIDGNFVYAGSGLSLNEFIKKTLDNGYVNFDNLYGIIL